MHKNCTCRQIRQIGHKNVNLKLNYEGLKKSPENVKPKNLYDRVDISPAVAYN